MVRLIVAEKPSVARDLARLLGVRGRAEGHLTGPDTWVTWCVGHLVELCEPHEHDPAWKKWSAEQLPMLPEAFQLRPVKSSAKQWKVVSRLLRSRDVTEVVNACDAGREGELIFRLAYDLAGCSKPVRRLWLSSLTDEAVRRGMGSLRPGQAYDALGDAARCRSEADWLVGMNATRAMTLLGRRGGGSALLSVGRVQTPTLAMLCQREDAIDAFISEPFWQVRARFEVEGGVYEAQWHEGKQDRLGSPEEAEQIASDVRGETGRVAELEQKEVRERPPLLYDLTQLQRTANRRFGMSASATLDAAQSLYERHKLITYPRTDSSHLPSDMVTGLEGILRGIEDGPYAPHCRTLLERGPLRITRRIVDDAEVTDHHAIIPTGKRPSADKLSQAEQRVLDLVVRRFIAVFYPDAVFATTRIETLVAGHLFAARGKVPIEPGWHAVEPPPAPRPPKDGSPREDVALPRVREGEPARVGDVGVHRGETRPPPRFTEATLLGAMERAGRELEEEELRRAMKESGLGTPATRAAIIETLLQRDFVRRDGKSLVPTEGGRALIAAIPVEDLKIAALTGAWEAKLAAVAAGRMGRSAFMGEVRGFTSNIVARILGAAPPTAVGAKDGEVLGACPVCGTPVREAYRTYSCERGKSCTFVIYKEIARRKVSPALVKVLLGRGVTIALRGFRSKAGKPFTAALALDAEGKVELRFDQDGKTGSREKKAPKTSRAAPEGGRAVSPRSSAPATRGGTKKDGPAPCPRCRQGTIIRGRRGWGCSRWRDGCAFVVWFEQGGLVVPDDEAERLFRKGKTRLMSGLGGPGKARLVLDLSADGNVRIEAGAKRKKAGPK